MPLQKISPDGVQGPAFCRVIFPSPEHVIPAATEPIYVQVPQLDEDPQSVAGTHIEKDEGSLQPKAPGVQGPVSRDGEEDGVDEMKGVVEVIKVEDIVGTVNEDG